MDTGRLFCSVALQDEGHTLKVFLSDKETDVLPDDLDEITRVEIIGGPVRISDWNARVETLTVDGNIFNVVYSTVGADVVANNFDFSNFDTIKNAARG